MKTPTVVLLLMSVHQISAQLNFEGNPLTENTDYLAEESQLSERTARQNNPEEIISEPSGASPVSPKENPQPVSSQKFYPVYSEDLGREVLIINSGSKAVKSSGPIEDAKPLESSQPVENSEPVENLGPEKKSRQLQDNFINTNSIQPEKSYQQQTINPADLALQMFLNSKTQKESEVALNYYLQGGQGLAEQLEIQKHHQEKLKQQELMRQQEIMRQQELARQQELIRQQEQIRQQELMKQQEQMKQQEHMRQQQIQQEQMRQQQIQQKYLEQQNPKDQLFRQQNFQPQVHQVQQNQQVQIQNQQQQQSQELPVQPVDSVPQSPQIPGPYPYPRVPFIQPRSDLYGRPMRRQSYRTVPSQSRMSSGIYKGIPSAPIYPGKMIKPPVAVIYSRPPAYARGAPFINGPPGRYEDASPWFPESDHQPPAKDIYYSQLYAQSYDPHYYNYIAKTGKIKPHLYGKLNPEENQDEGILAELFRGFKNHGIKNIMNPTFLLGMTIPALTFMLTALVQKRSLARSDSRSFDQEEIREYLERLQKALVCHRNSRVATTDDRCWR